MNSNSKQPEIGQKKDRREFLKGAATAAAAGAAVLTTQTVSAAQVKGSHKKISNISLTFDARKTPSRDDIILVLDKIFEQVGCYNCGLSGLDLRLGTEEIMRFDAQVPVLGIHHR